MTLTLHAGEALAVLRRIAARHMPVALASSFGAEDMVLIDLIGRHELPIRVFTLDTGRLHEETYALIDRVRKHYGLAVAVHASGASALAGMRAWITGARRASVTRSDIALEEFDTVHSLPKFNPLVDWSDAAVRTYLRGHGVPYKPLHDRAFAGMGCAPYARAFEPGEGLVGA